jgi:hypothetical protein
VRGRNARRACWIAAVPAVVLLLALVSPALARVPAPRPPSHGAVTARLSPAVTLDPFATINPTVPPSIGASPPAQVDELLTVNPGTWPGSGWTFTYQWLDCDPANASSCVQIPGATLSTYTVDPADGGSTLAVQVNADDHVGDTGSATSAPTATVVAQPGAPVVQSDPAIAGAVTGGVAAIAADGTWSPTPDTFTTQWLSCTPDLSACGAVGAANSGTYTPTMADIGDVLVFGVFATKNGLDSVYDFSAPSNVVAFPPPTVAVSQPRAGLILPAGSGFLALYSCTPPPGMGLLSCSAVASNGLFSTPVANVTQYTPNFVGAATFTVTAQDQDGRAASAIVDFSVGPPFSPFTGTSPGITISSPVDGATYTQGATVLLQFNCVGYFFCFASGPVAPLEAGTLIGPGAVVVAPELLTGSPIDTSQLGVHTITVSGTSVSNKGATTTATVTYTVVASPTATVRVPPLGVSQLDESHKVWRLGGSLPTAGAARVGKLPIGTSFTLTSTGPASVTIAFASARGGRLHGARCVAVTRSNRRARHCVRSAPAGSILMAVPSGADAIGFEGRLNPSTKLSAGAYTATVTAQALEGTPPAVAGFAITVGTLRFKIVK